MIDLKYNGTENVLVAFQKPPYLYWGNDFDFRSKIDKRKSIFPVAIWTKHCTAAIEQISHILVFILLAE
jgi:hypothetical protein